MKPLSEQDLLEAFLDGSLPDRDKAALEQRLRTEPALADQLMRLAREEAILTEWAFTQAVEAELVEASVPCPVEVASSGNTTRGYVQRWLVVASSIAAAVGFSLLLPAETVRPGAVALAKTSAMGRLEDMQGEVFVVPVSGEPVVARAGQKLRPGQRVRTRGEGSSAVVSLADARRVEVGTDTTVRLLAGLPTATDTTTKLYLEEGSVAPEVAGPTKDRPMLLATPHGDFLIPAESRVSISSDARGARVETEQGSSQVVNKRDGRAIDVPSGWFAVVPAQGGQQIAAQQLPPAVTKPRVVLQEGIRPFQSAAYSPDASLVVLGGADGTLRLLNLTAQRLEIAPIQTGKLGIRAVAYAPTGMVLAASADERQVKVFGALIGEELTVLRNLKSPATCLAFSPDGMLLAAGCAGKNAEIKIWRVDAQLEQASLTAHGIQALVFSPDGRTLAAAGREGSVKFWDLSLAKERLTLPAHSTPVSALAFSPDGSLLATAGRDRTVKIWNTTTGKEVLSLQNVSGDVRSLTFSPDGKRLAAADNAVRIWDVATGQQVVLFKGHRNGICAVAFSPDGKQLTTAGWDRAIRIWDVPGEQP